MAKNDIKIHAEGLPLWKIDDLTPYAANAKEHPDEQIDLLVKSFKTHGFHGAITIDEKGEIITGHGRRLAAIKAGMSVLPVVIVKGASEAKKREMRIKDNTLARTDMDLSLLASEFDALKSMDSEINIDDFGFNETEMDIVNVDIDDLLSKLESESADDSDSSFDDAGSDPADSHDDSPYKHSRTQDEHGNSIKYPVIVNCSSQEEQNLVFEFAKQHGLRCNLK